MLKVVGMQMVEMGMLVLVMQIKVVGVVMKMVRMVMKVVRKMVKIFGVKKVVGIVTPTNMTNLLSNWMKTKGEVC